MKFWDSSDVPRVTCRGARQEATRVVNEEGDDYCHHLPRKLGDWGRSGRTFGGRLWGTSNEQPLILALIWYQSGLIRSSLAIAVLTQWDGQMDR